MMKKALQSLPENHQVLKLFSGSKYSGDSCLYNHGNTPNSNLASFLCCQKTWLKREYIADITTANLMSLLS